MLPNAAHATRGRGHPPAAWAITSRFRTARLWRPAALKRLRKTATAGAPPYNPARSPPPPPPPPPLTLAPARWPTAFRGGELLQQARSPAMAPPWIAFCVRCCLVYLYVCIATAAIRLSALHARGLRRCEGSFTTPRASLCFCGAGRARECCALQGAGCRRAGHGHELGDVEAHRHMQQQRAASPEQHATSSSPSPTVARLRVRREQHVEPPPPTPIAC